MAGGQHVNGAVRTADRCFAMLRVQDNHFTGGMSVKSSGASCVLSVHYMPACNSKNAPVAALT